MSECDGDEGGSGKGSADVLSALVVALTVLGDQGGSGSSSGTGSASGGVGLGAKGDETVRESNVASVRHEVLMLQQLLDSTQSNLSEDERESIKAQIYHLRDSIGDIDYPGIADLVGDGIAGFLSLTGVGNDLLNELGDAGSEPADPAARPMQADPLGAGLKALRNSPSWSRAGLARLEAASRVEGHDRDKSGRSSGKDERDA